MRRVIFATSIQAGRSYIEAACLPIQTTIVTPSTLDRTRGMIMKRSEVVFVSWSTDEQQFSDQDRFMIGSRIREE